MPRLSSADSAYGDEDFETSYNEKEDKKEDAPYALGGNRMSDLVQASFWKDEEKEEVTPRAHVASSEEILLKTVRKEEMEMSTIKKGEEDEHSEKNEGSSCQKGEEKEKYEEDAGTIKEYKEEEDEEEEKVLEEVEEKDVYKEDFSAIKRIEEAPAVFQSSPIVPLRRKSISAAAATEYADDGFEEEEEEEELVSKKETESTDFTTV